MIMSNAERKWKKEIYNINYIPELDCDLQYKVDSEGLPIQDITPLLLEIMDKKYGEGNWRNANLVVDYSWEYYDTIGLRFEIKCERLESQDEADKRVERAEKAKITARETRKRHKKEKEEAERAEWERLREKFGD